MAAPARTRIATTPWALAAWPCHQWAFPTHTFQKMLGKEGGGTGIDDDFAARGFANVGAWILGRNMFGPIRGEWPRPDPGRDGAGR